MAQTSGMFGKLKRLFSSNTVVRNIGGKKLKLVDTGNIQSVINRRGVDRFSRVYQSATGGYGSVHGRHENAASFQGARLQLFRDYDMMDADPIIGSVLDIYADESTVKDEFGRILSIKTDDTEIKEVLHNLFYDILNIEFNLWPWIRNMCKYGDFFLFLYIDEEYGVINAVPLSIYETIRIEGAEIGNPNSVKFKIENDFLTIGRTEFENFEIAHFRLLADTNFLPYGKAMIENGRRTWKQLQLMEDAMLIHRIMRAPDKRKFKIDIGNIPPNEIDAYMTKVIDTMKKTPLIDPKTGDYNLRFNMINITEDYFFPVRGKEAGTDVENLQGLQFNAIEDIEYLRKKLLAAFKVPKSFIGYDEDTNGKATLASQDVRFTRTIERIQRIVVSELTKIAVLHLYVQGFSDDSLVNFEISLSNPSTLYEQEKLNIWREKYTLAQQMTGGQAQLLSQDWVYMNILEMSEQEIEDERKKISEDNRRQQQMMMQMQPPMSAQPETSEQPATSPETSSDDAAQPTDASTNTKDKESDEYENQIDSVEDILQSLKNLDAEEDDAELDEIMLKNKGGRPREGLKFSTDAHPLGRDPLGRKENKRALRRENAHMGFIKSLKLRPYKKIIVETDNSSPDIEENR